MDMKHHSPAHFSPCTQPKGCRSSDLHPKPIPKIVQIEEPEPAIDNRKEYIILPCERKLMCHFTAHYGVFLEHLESEIEEAFLMTESDKIALYAIYCNVWGQNR